ncbi:FKBP-type peptidyl-prolyl cis-trans isomerase [Sphingomonas glacialis]|uniref:Peptidyl-prolyl cis-trans isomerase n=1 Tax=Sphingomonas glacialis TaxID=658225 RepID=A0A502G1M8_9SPHN|nr:FKBP-type peptidyl-prolyl cis-trans isomerase [Sphingomonas glacialis]TPG55166.1 FKBP-type peptidyl-prolyl cis-trans isomerase [Sphingomonas glacialis]
MRTFAIAGLIGAILLPAAATHAAPRKVVHRAASTKRLATVPPLSATDAFLATNAKQRGVVTTPSGLQYRVLTPGTGPAKPTDADVTLVNYVGKLTNGTTFDQSARPTPMPVSGVVPGFSEALKAMPKGAKYRVWIKPSLGYGDQATGPIPAGSVLVFDIELLDFISGAQFQQMQQQAAASAPAAP